MCSAAASAQTGSLMVFGGSGKTGSECVYQALKLGRKVVVLARNPHKLVIPKGSGGENGGATLIGTTPKLITLTGSVTNASDVERAFEAGGTIDGVIIALGGRTKDVGMGMLTNGTTNIIHSMTQRGIQRVAVLTSIGCGDSMKQAPWSFWALMLTVMRNIMKDKNDQERLFLEPNSIGSQLE